LADCESTKEAPPSSSRDPLEKRRLDWKEDL
jgi:hypothetical protein